MFCPYIMFEKKIPKLSEKYERMNENLGHWRCAIQNKKMIKFLRMSAILVSQKVIDAKKVNVLPKKSPIVDEEALKKAEEEQTQVNVADLDMWASDVDIDRGKLDEWNGKVYGIILKFTEGYECLEFRKMSPRGARRALAGQAQIGAGVGRHPSYSTPWSVRGGGGRV